MTPRAVLQRVVIATLCVTAAWAIIALLAGDFGATQGRILLTTTALGAYGLLGLPAGLLLERRRLVWLAWLDALLAALGFLLALNLIWAQWDDPAEAAWKSLVAVTAAAGAAAQAAAAQLRRRESDTPAIRQLVAAGVIAVVSLATLISAAALWEIDDPGYYRFLGAVAVLDVLLLVLVPVLRRGSGRPGERARTYRVRVVGDDGRADDVDADGGDFAAAVAAAIRSAERNGRRVTRVERL